MPLSGSRMAASFISFLEGIFALRGEVFCNVFHREAQKYVPFRSLPRCPFPP